MMNAFQATTTLTPGDGLSQSLALGQVDPH